MVEVGINEWSFEWMCSFQVVLSKLTSFYRLLFVNFLPVLRLNFLFPFSAIWSRNSHSYWCTPNRTKSSQFGHLLPMNLPPMASQNGLCPLIPTSYSWTRTFYRLLKSLEYFLAISGFTVTKLIAKGCSGPIEIIFSMWIFVYQRKNTTLAMLEACIGYVENHAEKLAKKFC